MCISAMGATNARGAAPMCNEVIGAPRGAVIGIVGAHSAAARDGMTVGAASGIATGATDATAATVATIDAAADAGGADH